MARESQLITLKKNHRVHVSKNLNIAKTWYALKSSVAEHISEEYTPIPHFVDTKAYQIGNIFVQEASNVNCFCAAPQLKILGPIRDFLVRRKSSPRWSSKNLPLIKTTPDEANYRVLIENGRQLMQFRAYDCYFLDIASDMSIVGEVTIDRSTHEDLAAAEWFGLITGVVMSNESDIIAKRNSRERTFLIGEAPHTILFKHQICKMDKDGSVYETTTAEMECKWLPVEERDMDALPLTEFVSQSTKVKCE